MKIITKVTRSTTFHEEKFSISSESFTYGENWFNCLYLSYHKEDFPNIPSPEIIPGFRPGELRFDYNNCDIARLDWHKGITYYSESKDIETGKTLVKAGCDYQHLGDDIYRYQDSGESILKSDGVRLAEEFKEKFIKKEN